MHWAIKYIGLPYEAGARGPDRVDCWGLVKLAYDMDFCLDLPTYPGISLERTPREAEQTIRESLAQDWILKDRPFDGCLVGMTQRTEIHHVALYADVDGGRIIHCWHSQMVVADTLRGLRMRGMRLFKYYQHKLWDTLSKPQMS